MLRAGRAAGAIFVLGNKSDLDATARQVLLTEATEMLKQKGVTNVMECTNTHCTLQ